MTSSSYLNAQIITYMGNKRKLIPVLSSVFDEIIEELNANHNSSSKPIHLTTGDAFSGSGIVSRLLKTKSSKLFVNDISGYSEALNSSFLSTPTKKEYEEIINLIQQANIYADNSNSTFIPWISRHWSPQECITKNDRVYFTRSNGIRIDKYRHFIEYGDYPKKYKSHLLASLLIKSSIHNNTNGQFSAFYKDERGIGKYGGKKEIDLKRITSDIRLELPVFHNNNCETFIYRQDVLDWVKSIPPLDIIYIDPPYNKHPYSIFYFLLDIIYEWNLKEVIPNTYRGQPKTWEKSPYNSYIHAKHAFETLIKNIRSKYIVLSYNNNGIIPIPELENVLTQKGNVRRIPVDHRVYNRLKGIANYKRSITKNEEVNEYIWIVDCR